MSGGVLGVWPGGLGVCLGVLGVCLGVTSALPTQLPATPIRTLRVHTFILYIHITSPNVVRC